MKNTTKELSDLKILIVDDVATNTILLKSILKSEGYQLDTANDGFVALEKIEQWRPDIILLDVMMPGMSGFEVAETIRKNPLYENISIIFSTALNDIKDIVHGFESGGNDYITKPFVKKEVLVRVRQQALVIVARNKIIKQSEELEMNIKWRDKLYSVVAHDLRDPLGAAKMLLTMALDETKDKEGQAYEFLQMANDSINNTFYLLNNLLKWTKSQIGNTEIIPRVISMKEIIDGNVLLLKFSCENKGITMNWSTDTADKNVYADYDMMNTVVRNLLSNAIKYSHDGGKIDITITYDDKFAILSIKDYGVGIKDEYTHKILNNKSDFTTPGKNNEVGHGLGLLLCKYFVEINKGTISFDSTYGEGTEFFINIPLCEESKEKNEKN